MTTLAKLLVARRAMLLAAASSGACSRPRPTAGPPTPPALRLGRLPDLAAAAGLSWLVVMRPGVFLRTPGLRAALDRVAPARRLDDLATTLGFDPRLADDAVIAAYGTSLLFILRVAHDPALVEERFRVRSTGPVERATDGPDVTRIASAIGRRRRSLALLGQEVVVLEVGPGVVTKAAVAFARGRLRRSRPALATAPLAGLRDMASEAPLVAFAPVTPGPGGAHGLLARAEAFALAVSPEGGTLRVRGVLAGAWDDSLEGALTRLEATVGDVIHSPLGHLTGLDAPVTPYAFAGDAARLRFEAVVDARRLADGLYAATGASLRELAGLDASATEKGASP